MITRAALVLAAVAAVGLAAGAVLAGPLGGAPIGGGALIAGDANGLHHGHGLFGGRGGLAAKLGLTAQQREEIHRIITHAREEMKEAKGILNKARIIARAWEKISRILTPQQLQMLEQMHKTHHGLKAQQAGQGVTT